ncbi:hypothetical protein AiwAL_03835 [Acidiphilium sp. AL]|uniref:Nucleoside phosphorylase domain-containing protein n=1 Tax=Acidiphilium iwatense TaxID=768198 RepID=A0ABS9DT25_9PROT|nr:MULTISPECIES: hypothetical protein [Acidiphilium]MCF3945885.1 hypothetical protein [Acidiphilium iwatense]MCU4159234.1 hypothetical protein [Acidiphilium sp. AL]
MTIGFVTGLAAEARLLAGVSRFVGIGGGTPEGAATEAERLIGLGAAGLISFGLAGGLDPALPPGFLLVPQRIVEQDSTYECDPRLIEKIGGVTVGLLLGGDAVAATIAAKAALFGGTGASAIDLESGAIARVARAHGVPFAVLRAVADPAWRDLPAAAIIALDHAGRIAIGRIALSIARQPGQLPALMTLARDAAKARSTLLERVRVRFSTSP